MAEFVGFLRWLIEYAVSHGFWHFIAVWFFVGTLTRILWFVRVTSTAKTKIKGKKEAADA